MYSQYVPRFCLDRSLLGTERDLIVDGHTFQWVACVPKETWHLDGTVKDHSDWCLDTALRVSGTVLSTTPPDPFVKAMSSMSASLGGTAVPWQRVMPARAHLGFVKGLVEQVKGGMNQTALEYYRTVWVAGNVVLKSLKPACIDEELWHAYVTSGTGNVPAIKSFEPDESDMARSIKYDRLKTLTGRLTVDSGPQILTIKREHRDILRSVYGKDGSVIAFDFAALEARVLLYEFGRRCENVDLYGMIAKELGRDRKAIKGAVISELYGSSKWALGKHLGMEGKELNDFVRGVKAYFRTSELLERVKKQFVATGKVINRYGRPVVIDEPLDNIMISYYGQSTGVDVTMLGFKQVIETLKDKAPRTRPIYVLHDALLLDVHNDDIPIVQSIRHVRVPGYVQKFPLRLEKVGG